MTKRYIILPVAALVLVSLPLLSDASTDRGGVMTLALVGVLYGAIVVRLTRRESS